MSFDPAFSIKVFSAPFAIMNPVANVPVFLSLPSLHASYPGLT